MNENLDPLTSKKRKPGSTFHGRHMLRVTLLLTRRTCISLGPGCQCIGNHLDGD
jgi:hypothetical protein